MLRRAVHRDGRRVLSVADRPATLFYLDPPYFGREREYEGGFTREDFGHLAELLSGIEGRFMLSLNDHPFIRSTFAQFSIEALQAQYTFATNRGRAKRVRELLTTGGGKLSAVLTRRRKRRIPE